MAIKFNLETLFDRGTAISIISLKASGEVHNDDWVNSVHSAIESCEGHPPSRFLIDNTNALDLIGLEGFKGVIHSITEARLSSVRFAVISNDPLDSYRGAVLASYAKDNEISFEIELFHDSESAKSWLIDQRAPASASSECA